MNILIAYYSGAGNTKYIAQVISERMDTSIHDINICAITTESLKTLVSNYDLFIIGFPVYDFSATQLVHEFILKIKASNGLIAFFCTKAFLSGDSIMELSMLSQTSGLNTTAKLDITMPGTDALAFGAKSGSNMELIFKSIYSRNINNKVDTLIRRINKKETIHICKKWYSYLSVFVPKKTKMTFHGQYTKYIGRFNADEDWCTNCMLCVKTCPQNNITFNNKIKFGTNCDMCLKCLHHCPVEAIQIGNFTQGKSRYKQVEVKL